MLLSAVQGQAQHQGGPIQQKDVARIEHILAADSMEGRKIFTPGIEKASFFIEAEFSKIGLDSLAGCQGYRQAFSLTAIRHHLVSLRLSGTEMPDSAVIIQSTVPRLLWTQDDSVTSVVVGPGDDLSAAFRKQLKAKKNAVVWVNSRFAPLFGRLKGYLDQGLGTGDQPYSVVFILTDQKPGDFRLEAENIKTARSANNVVGVIPGKSRPKQYVIFSAHYDHLGTSRPVNGDSIYNGANDDASGTTAVIELAKYFKAKGDNERTLVFVTFTGEEEGGYGSRYFSEHMDPAKVVAMFNIEMIGTTSKWGKNSAYITGYDKTNFGSLLQDQLQGTGFTFHPDPYPEQNLFYRSDNATLARQGVPAHTISTSKMDNEPNYHQLSDEVATLDLANMTAIIRAIAMSASGIISGRDTPSRVRTDQLEK